MKDLPNILTVSELNSQIKILLEDNFSYINLLGEISNFKIHSQSGHFYFTLKDENSQIQAVMWKSRNESLLFTPEDGMQIVAKGRITLFQARGTYQIEVWDIRPQGVGELQIRFEKLKMKLLEEGLFDESHKKPIPKFPQNVVIITSKTGAVLKDFIKITKRRYPLLNLYVYPVNVQGLEASRNLVFAVKDTQNLSKFGKIPPVDIIVIARGGGSFEDLWPFNDETLARTIYECQIPVVSAVGHEVDFTICDFVSDLRAPTPSAAAELITPDTAELIENLDNFSHICKTITINKISRLNNSLKEIQNSYYFIRPKDLIYNFYQQLDVLSKNIINLTNNKLSSFKESIKSYKQTLFHINPYNNLKKGYAIITKKNAKSENIELSFQFAEENRIYSLIASNKILTRASQLKKDDNIDINFYDDKKPAKIIK
ncbi:MAG: exodeoxyribonuclease VII large subunit [Ignavibacteria bacterium]